MNETDQTAKFINPEEIMKEMEISANSIVADFGCGTGYFSFPIAKKISGEGKVYALDILPEKLEAVDSEAKLLGLTNIEVKRVNLEKENGSKLEAESIDWVILVDMLFQNKDKNIILNEAKRVLKNNGKILIVEWNENTTFGPETALRISKEKMNETIGANGLKIVKEIQAGDFHYGFVVGK